MRLKITIHGILWALFLFTASMGFARDYIIYSIAQDLPMGIENEQVKKNYYVNMGSEQGVKQGTKLNVYRTISRLDPYKGKKRYQYNVKIGELNVIHSEDNSAITNLKALNNDENSPIYDIDGFMIGDKVSVDVD